MCYVTVKILHKNPAQRLASVVYNPEKNFYSLQRGLKFHQKVFCSRSILLQFEKKKLVLENCLKLLSSLLFRVCSVFVNLKTLIIIVGVFWII